MISHRDFLEAIFREPTDEEKRRWWWEDFWFITVALFGLLVIVGSLIGIGILIGMRIGS